MKLMIFTEGTIIMHKNAAGRTRMEIVKQVKSGEKSVHDSKSYLPVGSSVHKLINWKNDGAKIFYLTSRTKSKEIDCIGNVLKIYMFPKGTLVFRRKGEEYKDVAERIMPDILIEDDCESIGGKNEMTITNVSTSAKKKIKSIVVKEFSGIDKLPDKLDRLLRFHRR